MQFKVPQFLEIEDKIFGPFTFRQFIYLGGGAGLCFILYRLLGLFLGAIPILMVASFCGALTFYRPNNKPFIYMVESGFKYFTQNKLYIWKKDENGAPKKGQLPRQEKTPLTQMLKRDQSNLSGSKLRDLAWSLDVLDLSKNKNTGN